MYEALVLAQCVNIAVRDVRTHRITNRSIALLAVLLSFNPQTSNLAHSLIWIAIALLACHSLKAGMGDFKLVAVLMLLQGDLITTTDFLAGFFAAAVLSLLISLALSRSIKTNCPLAPAILAPFSFANLAM